MKNNYILYPSTGHICAALIKLWNTVFPSNPIKGGYSTEWTEYHIGRLCEVALVTVDFRAKPTTVVYEKNEKPRGFTGWTIIDLKHLPQKIVKQLTKTLTLAQLIGIGKSRSIGFGYIEIKKIEKLPTPPQNP
ncbi:MAG: CRISPR system precrRNA processing endoribonuclease RAMP protein Cas6, partial [Ignisphaera sp.]|nr:CRISPR system precrRNA processing endoribonuclease RAMP protein Cas6 [Ignisphaera sp.]MDW8086160.1 CRISPR system precrRNA processing endoribonuclease RAMP protein Cas6 [Ignisphaera sp.]